MAPLRCGLRRGPAVWAAVSVPALAVVSAAALGCGSQNGLQPQKKKEKREEEMAAKKQN